MKDKTIGRKELSRALGVSLVDLPKALDALTAIEFPRANGHDQKHWEAMPLLEWVVAQQERMSALVSEIAAKYEKEH